MDGDGDGGVIVVTGSPGAGKSALLGLLVCAAHPSLRGATHGLWRAAAARPSENTELAAVAVTADYRGTVRIWDLEAGTKCRALSAAVTSGRTVWIWDFAAGAPVEVPLTDHTGPVVAVACTMLDSPARRCHRQRGSHGAGLGPRSLHCDR